MIVRPALLFLVTTAERNHGGYLPRVVHADCPLSGSSRHAVYSITANQRSYTQSGTKLHCMRCAG